MAKKGSIKRTNETYELNPTAGSAGNIGDSNVKYKYDFITSRLLHKVFYLHYINEDI